jgi:hypothetical protein
VQDKVCGVRKFYRFEVGERYLVPIVYGIATRLPGTA